AVVLVSRRGKYDCRTRDGATGNRQGQANTGKTKSYTRPPKELCGQAS
ncbi:hypothetical protein A2U01_0100456, partial [Trifolium medium]|nr:hypothetical protein [Trifolium medium]